ncbi:ABC transporter, ATP-binding protein [Desulfamplus magnetovallimortis]|uniref:ABC transporter, ATP-binding protein n=1 Tax=Desulfamplus magnetovallimortis TaxID=1246637 RepID=A0A1W1HC54_9BACT|nr:polysaccharide ABC transporter ATP-binding protein [Desulfamplus magnetovallimortis]SLM29958.1 ABC transporter, ATP-binding protein [Desulfamplus magnetovallimortis]
MSSLVVKNISKSYRLYNKPLDRLKEAILRKQYHQAFHSLQDISFSIEMGETMGIVGDNGAGKSTLLKILAGTLQQSDGEIKVSGRISALLELGSGFHYEFTGRQNIWMNASLMGLEKKEIEQWEDEIINFSELRDFIDRPIKTYSSGMVVRLAFSIATVVDPDILIIDEALSVGDQHFQKKCVDKMVEIKNRGKIILFCSHSLYLVNMLCDNAIWIDNGRLVEMGRAEEVTASYENFCRRKKDTSPSTGTVRSDSGNGVASGGEENIDDRCTNKDRELDDNGNLSTPVNVTSILLNGCGDEITLTTGDNLVVDIECKAHEDVEYLVAAVIKRSDQLMCHAAKINTSIDKPLKGRGCLKMRITYPAIPFYHGEFAVEVLVSDNLGMLLFDKAESAVIRILPENNSQNELGLLKLDHKWDIL